MAVNNENLFNPFVHGIGINKAWPKIMAKNCLAFSRLHELKLFRNSLYDLLQWTI